MRAIAIIAALGGCSLNADYTGTYYHCGPDGSCPDNYVCQEQVCIPVTPPPPACSPAVAAGGGH